MPDNKKLTIGRIVHYVFQSAGAADLPTCRPAIVSSVADDKAERLDIVAFGCGHEDFGRRLEVEHHTGGRAGATWHWPAECPTEKAG